MSQVYIEIDCQVTPVAPWADLLIAALGEIGFESFENTDSGFMAYGSAFMCGRRFMRLQMLNMK